ncbi:hypothetical protein CMUS01_01460 [Colletotrichum musicola]|uniref:Uncharacterized protein n=1 Tax=Colletotrichum musicola TaxID=2175873 RepID=A0A8H6NWS3_9PEZI|nr:hypothetical protein CMUS01_01460 [Colletotrichum musicola]
MPSHCGQVPTALHWPATAPSSQGLHYSRIPELPCWDVRQAWGGEDREGSPAGRRFSEKSFQGTRSSSANVGDVDSGPAAAQWETPGSDERWAFRASV